MDEKQIKEMAEILQRVYDGYGEFNAVWLAEHLAVNNIGKLPENAVVFIPTDEQYALLSKEEYEGLQMAKDFNYGYHEGEKNMEAYYKNIALPQARKETAREFVKSFTLADFMIYSNSEGELYWVDFLVWLNEIAKQFGVEVE